MQPRSPVGPVGAAPCPSASGRLDGRGAGNLVTMTTVVLGERPSELESFLERRRALGHDLFDEVWKGSYHAAPAPSFSHGRVEAELAALLRPAAQRADLVMTGPFNLGTPDDHRVPDQGWHRVKSAGTWLPTAAVVVEVVSPGDQSYEEVSRSVLLDLDADDLVARIDWP